MCEHVNEKGSEPCNKEAVWCVGTGKNNIHLCEMCSVLPKYKRLRKRIPLKEKVNENCND